MSLKPWDTVASGTVDPYRIFTVLRETARSPLTGRTHEFVVLDAPDWIQVLPITPDGGVVFVRQYRHGTRDVTLEIPGGMVHRGESPERAAARELLEETGYAGDETRLLASMHPNPAIQRNRCHVVAALDARSVAPPTPDPGEELAHEIHPLSDVPHLIASGHLSHALVIAAFSYLWLDAEISARWGARP
jgi:8-oxo-dGTP pyrophosphatase MutT (NUDIX family)